MTERVDFYVLKSTAAQQRWIFACRLAEKAYLKDLRVIVLSESPADAKVFDDLLWTFNDRSFVPHQCCQDGHSMDPDTPVHVTAALEESAAADLLVNLSEKLPQGLTRFARIAEIVDADPERRRSGRERFKAYRGRQLTLETHQLDGNSEL